MHAPTFIPKPIKRILNIYSVTRQSDLYGTILVIALWHCLVRTRRSFCIIIMIIRKSNYCRFKFHFGFISIFSTPLAQTLTLKSDSNTFNKLRFISCRTMLPSFVILNIWFRIFLKKSTIQTANNIVTIQLNPEFLMFQLVLQDRYHFLILIEAEPSKKFEVWYSSSSLQNPLWTAFWNADLVHLPEHPELLLIVATAAEIVLRFCLTLNLREEL